MANAKLDDNSRPALTGVSNADGSTPARIYVDPATGRMLVTQDNQGLAIPEHDYIALTYTGSNLTGVVYKTGGSGGTTVATLTLAYTGSQLDSVTKS